MNGTHGGDRDGSPDPLRPPMTAAALFSPDHRESTLTFRDDARRTAVTDDAAAPRAGRPRPLSGVSL
ncbi:MULTISPECIES: hypothetical protein [unclassified Streptomyces]|uniref:hypothetical protein n=1 Tax=unclassified Streptomyces TaxID=2593676 RepID=UPI001BEAD8F3|nr:MULTISPECIES: hypothetical protein [unclassified Streptomyces]MBT2402058.1 hypothetical protein [Streptomyces sp. ISL-21]MBT2454919.1 hypothetical protein [Streptomyces sp. ISL-86]MBT2609432.1 hypothetical protein [Streptomyces sp. ISL-87]